MDWKIEKNVEIKYAHTAATHVSRDNFKLKYY